MVQGGRQNLILISDVSMWQNSFSNWGKLVEQDLKILHEGPNEGFAGVHKDLWIGTPPFAL
jgi:hypothetical protein